MLAGGKRFLSSPKSQNLVTQPVLEALFARVKLLGRESDHYPSSAEVNHAYLYLNPPPQLLYGVVFKEAAFLFEYSYLN